MDITYFGEDDGSVCILFVHHAKLTKIYRHRNLVDETIFTGTLIVDYGCPLYKGNFYLLSGKAKTGKKSFLRNIAFNFIKNVKKDTNKYMVYLTYSRSQALNLKKLCSGIEDNITIFTVSESPSDAEYYYLPTLALNYAKKLIENNQTAGKIDVLFCFDDISQFIFKEKAIFENSQQPYVK